VPEAETISPAESANVQVAAPAVARRGVRLARRHPVHAVQASGPARSTGSAWSRPPLHLSRRAVERCSAARVRGRHPRRRQARSVTWRRGPSAPCEASPAAGATWQWSTYRLCQWSSPGAPRRAHPRPRGVVEPASPAAAPGSPASRGTPARRPRPPLGGGVGGSPGLGLRRRVGPRGPGACVAAAARDRARRVGAGAAGRACRPAQRCQAAPRRRGDRPAHGPHAVKRRKYIRTGSSR
jgi:hypothetical protein